MTKSMLASAVVLCFSFFFQSATVSAQCSSCESESVDVVDVVEDCGTATCGSSRCASCRGKSGWSVRDEDGMVQPVTDHSVLPGKTLRYAAHDHFSPNPVYAYSNAGLGAGRTHMWNQQQATVNSWHGGNTHWRWGTPTALVVPANSSYGTNYAWGVGQTSSTPLYHQFGRGNAGVTLGGGQGMYPSAPYWPSSTNEFGIYPVRAPW